MPLTQSQKSAVTGLIKSSLRSKFESHNPEPAVMPFHTRLLGKDRLALYSFIHSLNTNFGTTIFEPVAVALASTRFKKAVKQSKSGAKISVVAQSQIQKIMDDLTAANKQPNKRQETELLRTVCRAGEIRAVKPTRVDLMLEDHTGETYLIDLKTAKPNKGGFKEYKRTLLEWAATVLYENPDAKVNTLIAIPYNPYEPKPYARWTMSGMLDLPNELKVAAEFWDFLGGAGCYQDLLSCFERAGMDMRNEINEYFSRFK